MEMYNFKSSVKGTNIYIYYDPKTRHGIIIDPGGGSDMIITLLEENYIIIEAIIITHGHYDHILDLNELKEYTGAKVYAMKEEIEILEDPTLNLTYKLKYELPEKSSMSVIPDVLMEENFEINVGRATLKVLHTPGHTKGSCCIYDEENGLIFTGDTLFRGNVGKTNLPTGNNFYLFKSVIEKLFTLPEETVIYPGHYEKSTIGEEKENNLLFTLISEHKMTEIMKL